LLNSFGRWTGRKVDTGELVVRDGLYDLCSSPWASLSLLLASGKCCIATFVDDRPCVEEVVGTLFPPAWFSFSFLSSSIG